MSFVKTRRLSLKSERHFRWISNEELMNIKWISNDFSEKLSQFPIEYENWVENNSLMTFSTMFVLLKFYRIFWKHFRNKYLTMHFSSNCQIEKKKNCPNNFRIVLFWLDLFNLWVTITLPQDHSDKAKFRLQLQFVSESLQHLYCICLNLSLKALLLSLCWFECNSFGNQQTESFAQI